MPPRLNHKKSRNGCQRCKKRRVKCDEEHPVCSHCKRHGVECEYGQVTQQTPVTNSPYHSPSSPMSEPSSEDINILEAGNRRLLELQLLHHYTSVVCPTFVCKDHQLIQEVMNKQTVALAFEHPFLLNSIFSLSSLHMSRDYQAPNINFQEENVRVDSERKTLLGRYDLGVVHSIYLDLTVKQQRIALSNVTTDNADALFIACVFASYLSSGRIKRSVNEHGAYKPPVQWLYMVRGLRGIINVIQDKIHNETLIRWMKVEAQVIDFQKPETMFKPEFREPFLNLLDWERLPEPRDSQTTRQTYETVLDYIGGIWKAIESNEPRLVIFRRCTCFGMIVPVQFFTFLDEQRPRALAVLAQFCAVVIVLNDHWAFHGWSEYNIIGLRGMLPDKWQFAMRWPMQVIASGVASRQ